MPEYIKKAAKKAAEFNSNLNRERMEERRAYFDLQTHVGASPGPAPRVPWPLLARPCLPCRVPCQQPALCSPNLGCRC